MADSKMTAAELRSWYDKNHSAVERFEQANDAVKQLRDVSKTYTKTISTFDKDTLRGYLQSIGSSEANLRNLSWYLYYRSQVYARICNFYANMPDLNCRSVIPSYDLVKGGDSTKMLKSFNDTLDILDNMRVQDESYNIFLNCFIQDVFYGIVFYDDTGIFIFPWSADYAKITGKYMTGDFSFAIDCSYFNRYSELLEYMPDPFQTMYNEYNSTRQKWQVVPDEYALCVKFRSEDYQTIVPPFVPIFEALINLADLEDVQAVAAEQQIYKLLWLELETISGSKNIDDWKVDPSLVVSYYNKMINDALPDYIAAAIVPGKLNEISFPNDNASDTSKVAEATETVLNTAGGAEVLNGATINNTYAFKMAAIQNTEYAVSSLVPQMQSWVNRFLSYQLSNPSKVKFFPVSVYTKDDYRDKLLEAGQYGLSTKLAYNTFNGFSEKETLALNFLEEEVLHLSEKLIPLNSSYTQSGNSSTDSTYNPTVGQGAPTKDSGDLTDSGESSRASSGNTAS